jgi:hypothetical protein
LVARRDITKKSMIKSSQLAPAENIITMPIITITAEPKKSSDFLL